MDAQIRGRFIRFAALAVIMLVLFSLTALFCGIRAAEKPSISGAAADMVSSPFLYGLAKLPTASGADSQSLLYGFKKWHNSLLPALIPALVVIVCKARELPCCFRQAGACTCLISISIGGHAPPTA